MAKKDEKIVDLALQGGGAHGAYTWGVLDRLLEEKHITIDAISGTSAGAMNGAVLVDGFMKNGREGAKEGLHHFWQRISDYSNIFSPIQQNIFEQMHQGWSLENNLSYGWFDMLSRMFSPYELNPFNFNPLREVLEEVLDVDALHACRSIKLFITATHVKTGQPRVFNCEEITVDALLASACIPFLFQSVEIDGEPYWDGGYVGNPSIWPLIYRSDCRDIILVQINPIEREDTPKRAVEIIDRLNEISFNSSLIAEMRAIQFVTKLLEHGDVSENDYKNVYLHVINGGKPMSTLGASSKLNADWGFFQHLRDIGRKSASQWLRKHHQDINVRSSLNYRDFLYKPGPSSTKKGARQQRA